MNGTPTFQAFFSALWGVEPFPWQVMLAERVAGGTWPSVLDLPTATGKTACIDIAVFALASQAERCIDRRTAPRRVWFVVDRRIVVDEAFARAQAIAKKLQEATDGPLRVIADRLRKVAGTERPLAVARLRGGILRDDGWARVPSQPAVITSTVDQLGSRLLFRGYGYSHLTAPIFAGLAANDSAIFLDEAHCSLPFLQTVRLVERYRGTPWAEKALPTPFVFVVMSATPPADIPAERVFPGEERTKALDHAELRRRLEATKQAELVVVARSGAADGEDPLVREVCMRARAFVGTGKQRVAVMVNRVATAWGVADRLQAEASDQYEVVLLTGRLRPYERDILVARWAPYLRARDPERHTRPILVVTTQCLEVGADFSFDALVTEAASLDALRQRFGRLDRLGTQGVSPAVIVIREGETDPEKVEPDPVYGLATAHTWKLLEKLAGGTIDVRSSNKGRAAAPAGPVARVDFGVEALRQALVELDLDDLSPCLAPAKDAPLLLPAHVDLLCQTAPTPHPEPDVQQYLHGIGRRAAEVQVVWRADLREGHERDWVETVAVCRPVTGEMLAVPLWRFRAWLRGDLGQDGGADVEGEAERKVKGEGRSRACVLWRGHSLSRVVREPLEVTPGDVVIVPAGYGMAGLAQPGEAEGIGRNGIDLWERALADAGRPAAVRLQRDLLTPWLDCKPVRELLDLAEAPLIDRDAIADAVEAVLAYRPEAGDETSAPPAWWLQLLRASHGGRIERHPAGGLVIVERERKRTEEPDLFADDDDLTCIGVGAQSLDEHSGLVRETVDKIAARCLPDAFRAVVRAAAWWHDCGKLDPRFQVLLHEGDELAALAADEPLAKSTWIPASPAARRAVREASGLPLNFRHEMVSVQIAEAVGVEGLDDGWRDLFLHLVAAHHGHARPLTPVCEDDDPPPIHGRLGGVRVALPAEERRTWAAHRIDSGLTDRFWTLNRRYGWWGLAYLEAIVRLADWYASGLRSSASAPSRMDP